MKFPIFNKKNQIDYQQELEKLRTQLSEASNLINQIELGNLQISISESLLETPLGNSLTSMKNHVQKIEQEEQDRNWLNVGLAKFSDILRNKKSLDLENLTNDILANLIKYINANQGAIFIVEENEKGNQFLSTIAIYAYNRKKYINKRIEIGEGLVGQSVLEKDIIYMTDIPASYINITSGLGEATPNAILITPLLIHDKVFGVLELASFGEFSQSKIDFVKLLSENIASTIKSVKDNERTIKLLQESQQQSEELRAQEEEVRQNMEEMQATQEEMSRKGEELSAALAEMEGILTGINATMAMIEFTPDGKVITANQNFLRALNYNLREIEGQHHSKFVPAEILNSTDYKSFWANLAAGKSTSGIFKRIDSTGKTIWLNAIYNPIFNSKGSVVKVVKFATDITAEQEMLAESKGILSGINATMATIEFKPDGTIISANAIFLKTMKYTLPEIQGQHHSKFVPQEMLNSEEYKTFWSRLAKGESNSGIFKRINSSGDIVWLNAIYNPITNANGEVIKVMKFATDITSQNQAEISLGTSRD